MSNTGFAGVAKRPFIALTVIRTLTKLENCADGHSGLDPALGGRQSRATARLEIAAFTAMTLKVGVLCPMQEVCEHALIHINYIFITLPVLCQTKGS